MSKRLTMELITSELVPMRSTDHVCSFGEGTDSPAVAVRLGAEQVLVIGFADPQAKAPPGGWLHVSSVDKGLLIIALTNYHTHLSNLPKDANVAGTRAHVGRLLDTLGDI